MGDYLIDNPPASQQFWPSRNVEASGGVVVHTSEGVGGDDSAENTAHYISVRSEPGSYHMLIDDNSSVSMMPDWYTAFGVAASGYNSTCWMICLACFSVDLDANDPATANLIDRAGFEIAAYWKRNNVDIAAAATWIGEDVKNRPGLANHGDVQPWDRTDAWARHPQRGQLEVMLINAIHAHAGLDAVPPTPSVSPPVFVPVPNESVWGPGSTDTEKVKGIQRLVGVADDGVYGPATSAAVAAYQQNVLRFSPNDSDGIWGPMTEEANNNLFAFLANVPAVPAVDPGNEFLAVLDAARNTILQEGSTGNYVVIAQTLLNSKGYRLVSDGIFGPASSGATHHFQSDHNLSSDGIIGPDTWTALVS
jgi:peptidoglycan hydrolase-like protein with peptidoglycan-binding domain